MPLDADAEQLLATMRQRGLPPLDSLTPQEARAQTAEAAALSPYAGAEVGSVDEGTFGGVPCLVVTPATSGPWPVLVWAHGGGWVIGSAEMSRSTARDLAAAADCLVVSVEYRLAPEHPFPAAYDDVVAVLRAVRQEATAQALGAKAGLVAVGGDSAGGNLAAAAALSEPGLVHQVLAYPVLDATMAQPSYREVAEGSILTAAMMRWFVELYVGQHDRSDPRISPLFAPDEMLSATSPAYVVTAGYDPLRDEGIAYAGRLGEVGVATTHVHFPGQMHGFFTMGELLPTGAGALETAAGELRKAFAAAAPT